MIWQDNFQRYVIKRLGRWIVSNAAKKLNGNGCGHFWLNVGVDEGVPGLGFDGGNETDTCPSDFKGMVWIQYKLSIFKCLWHDAEYHRKYIKITYNGITQSKTVF